MNHTELIHKAVKLLKQHYYGNIIVLALLFLLILFGVIPLQIDGLLVNVTAERYAIMLTVLAIPFSLKYFAYRLKKLPRPMTVTPAIDKYKSASFIRLYILCAVVLMNILLYGISRNMNFFWLTVVSLAVFLFCQPSYNELESLTEKPEEKTVPEEK